jgi:hypothetical protein
MTSIAKNSCSPTPESTILQSIARRLSENASAMLSSTARPNTPKAMVPIMKEAPDSVSLCAAEYRLYRGQANPLCSTT